MAIDPPRKERTHEEDLRIGGTDYYCVPWIRGTFRPLR